MPKSSPHGPQSVELDEQPVEVPVRALPLGLGELDQPLDVRSKGRRHKRAGECQVTNQLALSAFIEPDPERLFTRFEPLG